MVSSCSRVRRDKRGTDLRLERVYRRENCTEDTQTDTQKQHPEREDRQRRVICCGNDLLQRKVSERNRNEVE